MSQIEINKEWEKFFTLLYEIIRDFCEKLFRFWFLFEIRVFEMFRFVAILQNLTLFGTNIEPNLIGDFFLIGPIR